MSRLLSSNKQSLAIHLSLGMLVLASFWQVTRCDFINFDDERAAAGFKVLAELSRKTQVLFFTHHTHLADVAEAALGAGKISVCGLDRETPSVRASATNAA